MLGVSAATAHAHAPPLGAHLLSNEHAVDEVIVTNRGLVFHEPATGAARLLCNEALHVSTAELPNVALLRDGGLLVASSSGLRLSRDQGCTWSGVGQMERTNVPALASAPDDPNTVYVATYDGDAPGVYVTRDAGETWSLSLATTEGDYVRSLLVGSDDAAHVYATLSTFAPAQRPTHSLLRTRDGGQSWERLPLPLREEDYSATAAAIAPRDAETLILYSTANSPGRDDSRLLVSRDAGDTFEVALSRPEIRGASYGGSGQLWVAARDGLYGSDDRLSEFQQVSVASELGCVAEREGALLVCGHYAGIGAARFGIGVSSDEGQHFETLLDFASVDARVACAEDSPTEAACAVPWMDWQRELLGGVSGMTPGAYADGSVPNGAPVDARRLPAATARSASEPRSSELGASCALRHPGRWFASDAASTAWMMAAWLWRRSRRQHGSRELPHV